MHRQILILYLFVNVFAEEEASFYLSGTDEDISSFSSIVGSNGISLYSNLSAFPRKTLTISSGSHLTRSLSTTLSSGSSPFTVSTWIKCNTSSTHNFGNAAVSWGEPKMSNSTANDAVVLSVNAARVNVTTDRKSVV